MNRNNPIFGFLYASRRPEGNLGFCERYFLAFAGVVWAANHRMFPSELQKDPLDGTHKTQEDAKPVCL